MISEPPPTQVKSQYPLPEHSLGGLTWEEYAASITAFENWCGQISVRTRHTRIERYSLFLQKLCSGDTRPDSVFHDKGTEIFQSPLDRILYVLREIHELMWIRSGLSKGAVRGLAEKLSVAVGGSDFAALDEDGSARNAQFELRIASYFARNGYRVDLTTETDITAKSKRETFYVECKRVASEKQLQRRAKEAMAQLSKRMPASRMGNRHWGIVALDVTKVAYGHNGLTWGVTADHSRDLIRDALISSSAKLDFDKIWQGAQPLLVWLQIHISSMVENPPQPITLFSSYGVDNPRLGNSARRALARVTSLWPSGVDEAMASPPQRRPLQRSWLIPAGSTLWWSEAVEEWLMTGSLPSADAKAIVGELVVDGVKHEFTPYELCRIAPSLKYLRTRGSNIDAEQSAIEVVIAMYAYRNRYQEVED